jgi:predicted Zn-dependent peptidase
MNTKDNSGVISLVIQMLNKMKKGITYDELRIAKGNIKGKYLLSQEDNGNIVEYNGIHALFHDPIVSYHNLYKRCISRLTTAHINEVIKKYINIHNMIFGIMFHKEIPKKELEHICNQLK